MKGGNSGVAIDRSASSFLPNLKPGEAAIIGADFPRAGAMGSGFQVDKLKVGGSNNEFQAILNSKGDQLVAFVVSARFAQELAEIQYVGMRPMAKR